MPPLPLCSPGEACRRCCVCCTGSESGEGRSPGVRTCRDRHRTDPRPPPHPPGLTRSKSAGRRRGSYSGAWKREKCWKSKFVHAGLVSWGMMEQSFKQLRHKNLITKFLWRTHNVVNCCQAISTMCWLIIGLFQAQRKHKEDEIQFIDWVLEAMWYW